MSLSAAGVTGEGAAATAATPVVAPEPVRAPDPAPALAVAEPPRRKLSPKEKKAAKAEYMRRRRAAKAEEQAEAEAPTPEQVAASEAAAKAEAERIRRAEELLQAAIAGTLEAVTDTVQLVALDAGRPHFGNERANKVASLWAPILAPHINESTARHLPLVLALGGTTAEMYAWAHEYRAAPAPKAKEPKGDA